MAGKSNDRLGKRIADLDERVADVAREQRRLSELLKVQDNWHSETKEWLGRVVRVYLQDGETVLVGRLKWSDKYHIAVVPQGRGVNDPQVVNKGAISFLQLDRGGGKDGE